MNAALLDELANGSPMMGAAIENARHGLPVYPATPRDKRPLHRGWQRAATTKVEYLIKTWRRNPEANVGVACRGIAVLDADSRRGEDAVADLGLPRTATVKTSRGSHFYFLGNAPTVPALLRDVELRGKGSGVLGAGSVHPNGREYEWSVAPWECEPVPLPPVIRELIESRATPRAGSAGSWVPGSRSTRLLKAAAGLRGIHGVDNLAAVLHTINETQCVPPLPAEKVDKLARYALGSVALQPWIHDLAGFCADERLGHKARLILSLICQHADPEGRCFPGIRRLARLAGMRNESVLDAIRELEGAQRLDVTRDRRTRKANRYRLLPPTSGSNYPPSPPKGLSYVPPVGTPSVGAGTEGYR